MISIFAIRRKNKILKTLLTLLIVIIIVVSFSVMVLSCEKVFQHILTNNYELSYVRQIIVSIDDTIRQNQRVGAVDVVDCQINKDKALLVRGTNDGSADTWIYFYNDQLWLSNVEPAQLPRANDGTILGSLIDFDISIDNKMIVYNIKYNDFDINSVNTLTNKVFLRSY